MDASLLSAVGECVEAVRSAIPRLGAWPLPELKCSEPTRRGVATRTGNLSYVLGAAPHDRSNRLFRSQFQLARRSVRAVRPDRVVRPGAHPADRGERLR